MDDLVKKIDVILHQGKGGAHPLTHADLPWRDKAQRIIAKLSRQAYEQAQRGPHGSRYKYRHAYSIPDLAQNLVECLNTNDEHRAKALFLSYEGMKAIGGKRRKAKRRGMSHDEKMMVLAKKLSTPRKTCPRCAFFYDANLTACPQCGGRRGAAMGGKKRHAGGDSDVVDVMFRVVKAGEWKGTVEAWFPSLPGTYAYWKDMSMYAHIGQHSAGDIDYMQQKTRNATPSEYADLKRELESLSPEPYKLRVVKKMQRRHYEERKAACQ